MLSEIIAVCKQPAHQADPKWQVLLKMAGACMKGAAHDRHVEQPYHYKHADVCKAWQEVKAATPDPDSAKKNLAHPKHGSRTEALVRLYASRRSQRRRASACSVGS